jgi:hypothetical protein
MIHPNGGKLKQYKMTTLLERAYPKVWDTIFREIADYPNTTMRMFEGLKNKKWVVDLSLEEACWLSKEVLRKDTFSFGDIHSLFKQAK